MSRRRLPGFTLIELLVVIIIIAITSTVIVPAYARFWDRTRFDFALSGFQDMFVYAREQAILNDTTALLAYDPQSGTLTVAVQPTLPQADQPLALSQASDLEAVSAAAPAPRTFQLGEEFALARFTTGGEAGTTLRFRSDGTCEGAEALLISQAGYAAHLLVSPATGRVTVEDVSEITQ